MQKHITAAVLALIMSGSILTACGNSSEDSSPAASTADTAAISTPTEAVSEVSSESAETAPAAESTVESSTETIKTEETKTEADVSEPEEAFDENFKKTLYLYTNNFCTGKSGPSEDGAFTVKIGSSSGDSFEETLGDYISRSGCGLPTEGTLVVTVATPEGGSEHEVLSLEYTDTDGKSFTLTKDDYREIVDKAAMEYEEKQKKEYTIEEAAKQAYSYIAGKHEEILMTEGISQKPGTYTIDLSADKQENDFAQKAADKIKEDTKMPKSGTVEFELSEKDGKTYISVKLTNASGETAVYPEETPEETTETETKDKSGPTFYEGEITQEHADEYIKEVGKVIEEYHQMKIDKDENVLREQNIFYLDQNIDDELQIYLTENISCDILPGKLYLDEDGLKKDYKSIKYTSPDGIESKYDFDYIEKPDLKYFDD